MNVNNSLRGLFPDVTYHAPEDKLYIAYTDGAVKKVKVVTVDSGGTMTPIFEQPCENQGFANIQSVGGGVMVLWRNGAGTVCYLRNLHNGTESQWPGRFETWPCALGVNGFALNYLPRPAEVTATVKPELVVRDFSFAVKKYPAMPGTGIAFLKDDNTAVSCDDNRAAMLSHGIHNPRWAGELVCGEGDSGGVGVIHEASGKKTVYLQTPVPTFEPRIAQYRDRYAIVTGDYTTINVLTDITVAEVIGTPVPVPPIEHVVNIKGPLSVGAEVNLTIRIVP